MIWAYAKFNYKVAAIMFLLKVELLRFDLKIPSHSIDIDKMQTEIPWCGIFPWSRTHTVTPKILHSCHNYSKFRKTTKDLLKIIVRCGTQSMKMFLVFLFRFLKIILKKSPIYIKSIVFKVIASHRKFKSYPNIWFKSCYSYSKTWSNCGEKILVTPY